MLRYLVASLLFVALPLPAAAQVRTRFLIPVVAQETRGAHGTVWRSDLAISNSGAEDVSVVGLEPYCTIGACSPPLSVIQPQQTIVGKLSHRRKLDKRPRIPTAAMYHRRLGVAIGVARQREVGHTLGRRKAPFEFVVLEKNVRKQQPIGRKTKTDDSAKPSDRLILSYLARTLPDARTSPATEGS